MICEIQKDIIPSDTKKIVSKLLKGMGIAQLAVTGLLVVGNILERFDDVSHNRDDCFRLLKEMIYLAKVVQQFKERPRLIEEMQDVIKEAVGVIVEGSIMCRSHMGSSKFSK